MIEIEQVFAKKKLFSVLQPEKPQSVYADCVKNFENDLNRGQPLARNSTGQTIWHVCRVFSFLGYLVQKYFYLEKRQRFFKFYLFVFGQQKVGIRAHN